MPSGVRAAQAAARSGGDCGLRWGPRRRAGPVSPRLLVLREGSDRAWGAAGAAGAEERRGRELWP